MFRTILLESICILDIKMKKAKLIALMSTLLFHLILIVLAIYVIVWSAPEYAKNYGIEVNFGFEELGKDADKPIQPLLPIKNEILTSTPQEIFSSPKYIPQQSIVSVTEKAYESVEVDAVTPEKTNQNIDLKTESTQIVQPTPKEKFEKQKISLPSPPELNNKTKVQNIQNQGNIKNKKGNQGNINRKINQDALLGTANNLPNGAQLDMPGWGWEKPPKKIDQSQEQGKVIFEITIDEKGEIIGINTVFRSVSKLVANFYQKEVEKLTFSPNNPDTKYDGVIKGNITFIIKTR